MAKTTVGADALVRPATRTTSGIPWCSPALAHAAPEAASLAARDMAEGATLTSAASARSAVADSAVMEPFVIAANRQLSVIPADLVKRGVAVPDASSPYKVRLLIQGYPYANDGLAIWHAIEQWVGEYLAIYYPDDATLHGDVELQAWWKEVREVGHGAPGSLPPCPAPQGPFLEFFSPEAYL